MICFPCKFFFYLDAPYFLAYRSWCGWYDPRYQVDGFVLRGADVILGDRSIIDECVQQRKFSGCVYCDVDGIRKRVGYS